MDAVTRIKKHAQILIFDIKVTWNDNCCRECAGQGIATDTLH